MTDHLIPEAPNLNPEPEEEPKEVAEWLYKLAVAGHRLSKRKHEVSRIISSLPPRSVGSHLSKTLYEWLLTRKHTEKPTERKVLKVLNVLPRWPKTFQEKCAVLVAIHDCLNPKTLIATQELTDFNHLGANLQLHVAYMLLVTDVQSVTDAERKDYCRAVADVASECGADDIASEVMELTIEAEKRVEASQTGIQRPARDSPDVPRRTVICTSAAVQKFHVSRTTLRRLVSAGKLTDHRPEGCPSNQQFLLDEGELAARLPRKPT